ncbi:MAG: helix-turn-helix transcriptional regulator, partial [Bacteroidota bacterium]
DDDRKVIADFQQVRQRGKEGYIWVYTTTKIYRKIQSPISISIPVPNMGLIGERLTGLLEENMFMRQRYQHFASLTKREREVLKLVAVGVKRRHIAEQLHISLHTYDTHRRNIRRKLEIKSFADLMRYAHAFGLVS